MPVRGLVDEAHGTLRVNLCQGRSSGVRGTANERRKFRKVEISKMMVFKVVLHVKGKTETTVVMVNYGTK